MLFKTNNGQTSGSPSRLYRGEHAPHPEALPHFSQNRAQPATLRRSSHRTSGPYPAAQAQEAKREAMPPPATCSRASPRRVLSSPPGTRRPRSPAPHPMQWQKARSYPSPHVPVKRRALPLVDAPERRQRARRHHDQCDRFAVHSSALPLAHSTELYRASDCNPFRRRPAHAQTPRSG